MDKEKHIKRHKELHRCLDELIADMINQTNCDLAHTSIMNLIEWSFKQTANPTESNND